MRILLAHNSTYFPAMGGGDISNRLLMEALSALGHPVRVVTRVEAFGTAAHTNLLAELARRGIETEDRGGSVAYTLGGVEVRALSRDSNLRAFFLQQIAESDPDVIVTSTDDPGQLLFDLAVKAPRARVVYLIRATVAAPFGPDSSMLNAAKTAQLANADGVVGVSEYVAGYARDHGGLDAIHVPISLLESTEFPQMGRFDNRWITMVNPCLVKGITIFTDLAGALPAAEFAAVPTWGTNESDLALLRRCPNITILPAVDDIDEILRHTRLLLVPSIWAEARSRMVLEGMVRGIPVLASAVGGLKEAKMGVDYLLPVNPIRHYRTAVDANMVPIADVPQQDIEPWRKAVERLITDPEHYTALSERSRDVALSYARNLSAKPFADYLQSLLERPKKAEVRRPASASHSLSPEKRKLLAYRLQQRTPAKAPADTWFPPMPSARLRMFCFPHAGGGAGAYRDWIAALQPVAAAVPVRLPGREARLHEPAFESMELLVEALAQQMVPHLGPPFVLFGHSMGAIVGFELARRLRHMQQPQPAALMVSGARAPAFRLHHQPAPDPSEAELLEELRRLEGLPVHIMLNPELLRLALPALQADTRLYRNWSFQPGEALTMPIFAYSGATDPNVRPEHIAPWREQTTGPFVAREFAGGHFYLQTTPEFLPQLLNDLRSVSADEQQMRTLE